ncbi:AAA family ATPase [Bradyrhizobium sp. CCBAU 45321]|uniref:AAA family ATPase n=1 Tax=Bradyrhizobium sp. CCBAU 45321 TaxID=1641878 RepID=UPI002303BBE1|nr:AAA family ATPase [Bradyrhizobium sp. CCBAU 45321]
MKLTFAHIRNYKSHLDSQRIPLGPKFTILIGQNNSGKTALLEALNPNTFRNASHRIPQRGPYPPIPNPISEIDYGVSLTGQELEFQILTTGSRLFMPVPEHVDRSQRFQYASNFFASHELNFRLYHPAEGSWFAGFPSHQLFQVAGNGSRFSVRIEAQPDRQRWTLGEDSGGNDDFPGFVGLLLSKSYYGFRAERLSVAQCQISENDELAPNANNLASVLLQLPKNHSAHERFQRLVREIFPSIFWVGSRPISANTAEIEIVMSDSDASSSKAGITVSLNESGTGVGQVLALLYVVVTASFPRIIAIDEPNSFLHPGAAKKLISILKQFDHQYIISTHSSELIKIADPEYVHLIEWRGTQSVVQTLDQKNLLDQRKLLSDLGVSLSDVFGADQILWVEGPTEERCFPLLLEHLGLASPALSIASVVATDDLTGSRPRAKLAWEVYEKLSLGSALLPPALAFSLDREERTQKEMEDLDRASRGKAKFLPRRTYENYLVDPDAITAVVTELVGAPPVISAVEWIEQHQADRNYLDRPLGEADRWEVLVDAPKLLHDLFNALSDARVEYRKTTHSIMLTEWLLANKPDQLSSLLEYVRSLTHKATNGR